MRVFAVGATGSIGRLVVEEAIRRGHAVRAPWCTVKPKPVNFLRKLRWSLKM